MRSRITNQPKWSMVSMDHTCGFDFLIHGVNQNVRVTNNFGHKNNYWSSGKVAGAMGCWAVTVIWKAGGLSVFSSSNQHFCWWSYLIPYRLWNFTWIYSLPGLHANSSLVLVEDWCLPYCPSFHTRTSILLWVISSTSIAMILVPYLKDLPSISHHFSWGMLGRLPSFFYVVSVSSLTEVGTFGPL